MYTLLLCSAFVLAYCAWLYYRYNQLWDVAKQSNSFSKFNGVRIYKVMVIAMFAAVGISSIAARSLPVIVSTSQPAVLIPQFTAVNGKNIFMWCGWAGNSGMVYSLLVRNADGSSSPHSIQADEKVHVIEDETLKDTGTWTVTTRKYDTTNPLAGWTFNGDQVTILKVELRLPVGAVYLLPH